MMDDKEIDVVDLEIDEYGLGKRKQSSGPDRKGTGVQQRQGTLYGKTKTGDDFMRRFEQDKAIAEDIEQDQNGTNHLPFNRTSDALLNFIKKD